MRLPDVIWLASYPKSGNTWLRLLLANLTSGLDCPVGINSDLLAESGYTSRGSFDEVTLLESGMLSGREIECLQPAVYALLASELAGTIYVKIHDAFLKNALGVPKHAVCRRAVYVIRDPRDVAVSWSHHLGIGIDAAIAHMNSSGTTLAQTVRRQALQLPQRLLDWSGHVQSWTGQTDVPVHVVRYEDMKQDPEGAFARVLEFAGVAATAADIGRAARFSDFSVLQRQEQAEGFRERLAASSSPFFRRGEAGGWRRVLTGAQADQITAAHGATMSRFGYDVRIRPEFATATAAAAAGHTARTTGPATGGQ